MMTLVDSTELETVKSDSAVAAELQRQPEVENADSRKDNESAQRGFSTILVVDDFEPFRRLVFSILQQRTEFRVIGQATDGLEAVRKAEELQPDLVLLDIGLPKLNGIEAARSVRKFASHIKILFVSQQSSADLVREALGLGARGYVLKSHAGTELLPAIEAVLGGKYFVGSGLDRGEFGA